MPLDPRTTDETAGAPALVPFVARRCARAAKMACLVALASALCCDGPRPSGEAELAPTEPGQVANATVEITPTPPPAPSDPWAEVLASRVLVDGRLGPGSKLVALETIAAADAAPGCAACALAGKPKLVVAVAQDDEGTDEALRDLDAIHRYYADNGLSAVAIVAPFAGNRLITPMDPRAAIDIALAQSRRSRIALPVHVPARVDDGGNRVWEEYYAVSTTPLVLLVGADDRIVFSAAAPADWAALDRAIVEVLGVDDRVRSSGVAKSPAQ
jgi:hypothetical protein